MFGRMNPLVLGPFLVFFLRITKGDLRAFLFTKNPFQELQTRWDCCWPRNDYYLKRSAGTFGCVMNFGTCIGSVFACRMYVDEWRTRVIPGALSNNLYYNTSWERWTQRSQFVPQRRQTLRWSHDQVTTSAIRMESGHGILHINPDGK